MRRRPGITLVEVLIAIFIMAIGLLALLTLFPLGALRMAQALQDDRAASAASAGANICDAFNMRGDQSFDYINPPPANPQNFPPASLIGGGFPVYVDPYGVANGSGTLGASAATTPATPGIQRVVPMVIPHAAPYWTYNPGPPPFWTGPNAGPIAARYFTLLDDISFATNGLPDASTSFVQRGDRYTWAYMLHKLQLPAPSSSVNVDLNVVVYANRTTSVPGGEATYAAAGNVNDTAVALSFAGTAPNIRRGSWILDTSYNPVSGSVHGDFYRVVSVTTTGANLLNLELQTTISKPISAVTVLDNVVEVFERGTGDSSRWEFRNN